MIGASPAPERGVQEVPNPIRQASYWLWAVLLACVYFSAAKASLLLAIPPGYATAVWPPSGIALAALHILGARYWPGIWAGAAAVNLTVEASFPAAATIATGNTLEALAGVFLIRRIIGVPNPFDRGEDAAKFVAIAAVCPVVAATLALIPLSIVHSLNAPGLLFNWWTWWQGDAAGIIVVAPLILTWHARSPLAWTPSKIVEGACFAVLLLGATRLTFGSGTPGTTPYPLTFLIAPFTIWAAIRFGQREVATANTVVCGLAVWYTVEQRSPFASFSLNESLLLLLAFACTVVVTGLVLCAAVGELRKVAERRLSESEQRFRLMGAKALAENANQAKSEFLAKMSHELRTPLNSLMILAKLLADNAGRNLTSKQVQYAQVIHEAGRDLLALINDLLDLAKIESGAPLRVQVAQADLAAVKEHLERAFAQVAHDAGLRFETAIEAGAPEAVETDPRRLQQILSNLLSNAFKFTSQGGVALRILPATSGWTPGLPRLDGADAVVAFSVSDTGVGIPEENHGMIFDAFQQVDGSGSREHGGTGLGLSISKELAHHLGGEIRVSSVPGKGSTFTLYLPRTFTEGDVVTR